MGNECKAVRPMRSEYLKTPDKGGLGAMGRIDRSVKARSERYMLFSSGPREFFAISNSSNIVSHRPVRLATVSDSQARRLMVWWSLDIAQRKEQKIDVGRDGEATLKRREPSSVALRLQHSAA